MKYKSLIALLALISFGAFSQLPKGYELQETLVPEKLVVVKKKTKVGVYSLLKNEFVVKPGKDFYHYIKRNHCLFRVNKNEIKAYYIYDAGYTDSLIELATDENSLVFGRTDQDDFTLNKRLFDFKFEEIKDVPKEYSKMTNAEVNSYHFRNEKFGITKREDGLVSVFNFCNLGKEYDFPLVDMFGEDSVREVNGQFEFVYPPRDPAVLKSGVWNMNTQNWDVKPKYWDVRWMRDHCFALNGDGINEHEIPFFYDMFVFKKGELFSKKADIRENSEVPFNEILSNVKYITNNNSFVVFEEDGKVGLMAMHIFLPEIYDPLYRHPNFRFEVVLDPRFDQIFDSGHGKKYYTKLNGEFNKYEVDEGRWFNTSWKNKMFVQYAEYGAELFNLDDVSYKENRKELESCNDSEFICLKENSDKKPIHKSSSHHGMEMLNDSLLYIKYHEYEYGDDIPLIGIWGDDSMVVIDGKWYLVYPAPEPGVYHSGVFDVKNYKWLVPPNYQWITKHNEGYVLCKPKLNKDGVVVKENEYDQYLYSFQKNDGSFMFKDMPEEEFMRDHQHLLIENSNAEDVFVDPRLGMGMIYYVENGKMGLASYLERKKYTEPRTYIKTFNLDNRLSVINDSLMIERKTGSIKISMKEDFSIRNFNMYGRAYGYDAFKIHYQDSVSFIQEGLWTADDYDTTKPKVEITRKPVLLSEDQFRGKLNNVDTEGGSINFYLHNSENHILVIDNEIRFFDYPLADQYGEDSLNMFGDYVYPEPEKFDYSGVFDKTKQKWVVPMKYTFVQRIGNKFYADYKEGKKNILHIYDLEGKLIETHDYDTFDFENLKDDRIHSFKDLNYWFEGSNLMLANYAESQKIDLSVIDKLLVNWNQYTNYAEFWYYKVQNEDTVLVAPNILSYKHDFRKESYDQRDYEEVADLEFTKLNDSLLIVEDYHDYHDYELPLIDSYGYDSIDFNGDMVYPAPKPARYKSGVYNYTTSKWLVKPGYRRIFYKNGFFIGELQDNRDNKTYHKLNYSGVVIDKNAKLEE